MTNIHPTAIVSNKAELGNDIYIGPYAVIEDDVQIDNNCSIGPNAVIYDGARIGKNVKILQSASVSNIPQDLKYHGEEALFYIGDNSVIREFVTLHKGTEETGFSKIGKNCLLMAYAHVAHDCVLGDNCIIANSVQIGGHVTIDDHVIIGGTSAVHQFVKIGKYAMIGGGFRIVVDVPPYVLAGSEPLKYSGVNIIGLRRKGFSNDEIKTIKAAYSILFSKEINYSQAKEKMAEEYKDDELVKTILNFLAESNRGIIK